MVYFLSSCDTIGTNRKLRGALKKVDHLMTERKAGQTVKFSLNKYINICFRTYFFHLAFFYVWVILVINMKNKNSAHSGIEFV